MMMKATPIHYLADGEEYEPSRILETTERERLQTAGLANALSALDERSRRIVEARWLCEENNAATLMSWQPFNISPSASAKSSRKR
jgi:RNA polymerase sigma-32 factor